MRRCTLILTALLGLFACNPDDDRISETTTLLTSTTWTLPDDGEDQRNLKVLRSFKSDGTYIEDDLDKSNGDKTILKGKWKWNNDREISIICNSMSINGKTFELGDGDWSKNCYIFRITEVNKQKLEAITRHIGDSEDSGFAKQVTYKAVEI